MSMMGDIPLSIVMTYGGLRRSLIGSGDSGERVPHITGYFAVIEWERSRQLR
jgi:hypothetical protein